MDVSAGFKANSLAALRSAAETATANRENEAMKHDEQAWENEGGHMSSTAGRVRHVGGAELPYVVVLTHHESEATEHSFATMREAEAFIKRNTPVPGRALSALYHQPACDS
jgi:hypothetical protein